MTTIRTSATDARASVGGAAHRVRGTADNGLRDFLCLAVDADKLRVGPCKALAAGDADGMRINAGAIHGRLCSDYTVRLLDSFRDLYDSMGLSVFERYGIDPRVIECDLLKGLYNRIAFDYLLTGDIVHAKQAHIPESRFVSTFCGCMLAICMPSLWCFICT